MIIILSTIILLLCISIPIIIYMQNKKLMQKSEMQLGTVVSRHYDEIKNIYMNMRGWRHDFHNHIQTMKGYMALDQQVDLNIYLNNLDKDLKGIDTLIKSGNVTLDAILNSKISLARHNDISVEIDAYAKEKMTVSDIDLCIIIGNLIDNGIDACNFIENKSKRFIKIYIDILREQLYISITNSTDKNYRNDSGIYATNKNKAMHGNGLKRIDLTVDKYDGIVDRQNEPFVFCSEIMLPI